MKLFFLNVFNLRPSHDIYMIYIMECIVKQFPNCKIIYLSNQIIRNQLNNLLTNCHHVQTEQEYKHELNIAEDIDAVIEFDGIHKTKLIKHKKYQYYIKTDKNNCIQEDDYPTMTMPSLIEVQRLLLNLGCNPVKLKQFLNQYPKNKYINDVRLALDTSKTIVYFYVPFITKDNVEKQFIERFIKKLLETDSIFLILHTYQSEPLQNAMHHRCFILNDQNTTFYDLIHLNQMADVSIQFAGFDEHITAIMQKPLLLLVKEPCWKTLTYGCRTNYMKVANITKLNQGNLQQSDNLADKCYLLLSDLMYQVSLNIKTVPNDLRRHYFLLDHNINIIFSSIRERDLWNKSNQHYLEDIKSIIITKWTLKNICLFFNHLRLNHFDYVIGKLPLGVIMSLICVKNVIKKMRATKFCTQSSYVGIPLSYVIDAMQSLKRIR